MIVIPEKSRIGGVANYYRVVQDYYRIPIKYFIRGYNRERDSSLLIKLYSITKDYIEFYQTAKNAEIKIIKLNTSFGINGVLRDGIYCLISKVLKKKVIIFIHGWDEAFEKRFFKFPYSFFKSLLFKSDAAILLSILFESKIRNWGFTNPIYLETTVVDDRAICMDNIKINYSNKRMINVLFLASVNKVKGILIVIEMFEKIKKIYSQVNLIIAGVGDALEEVKAIVNYRNIEGVKFVGYVANRDKTNVFLQSDVYILPTYHGEGMPTSMLEAMAFGLPVITRPVGGIKDFFQHENMGYITESKDPAVFADYLKRLIVNPDLRKEISLYNAEFARKHFYASVVVKRLESIYQDVMNGTRETRSWQI